MAKTYIPSVTEVMTEGAVRDTFEVHGDAKLKNIGVGGSAQRTLGAMPYSVPLNSMRIVTAWKDALADAPAASQLGLSDTPGDVLKGNLASGNRKTDLAGFMFMLPPEYEAGEAITVRVRAKKDTTAATAFDRVDVTAQLVGDTIGSDICATAIQNITTSYVNYDFVVTPTGLGPGDLLWVTVTTDVDDTGGTVNKAAWISRVEMRCTGW